MTTLEKPQSNQDFFNKAWRWLVIDKHPKSFEVDGAGAEQCRYRTKLDNSDVVLSCIAGAFIPDSLYRDGLERRNINALCDPSNDSFYHPEIAKLFEHVNQDLLWRVQQTHDAYYVSAREDHMNYIAKLHNLTIPSPDETIPTH
jgi:hypothetical protein